MLILLSWLFYFQGLSSNETHVAAVKKFDVLLLDEPDRHFDPSFIKTFYDVILNEYVKKHNIQVIMTTHRTDILALAPPEYIFTMEKKPTHIEINSASKMLAIAKLSKNMRDYMNFHVKVFTEGFDDALFYSAVYNYLQLIEINLQGNHKFFSRRWQPEFHSVCYSDANSGGCTIVMQAVERNIASYSKLGNSPQSVFPKDTMIPFGIVDDDFGNTSSLLKGYREECRRRILVLTRHSLENFLHDPFLIISLFDAADLIKFIGNKPIRESLINLKSAISKAENVQEAVDEFFRAIEKIQDSLIQMMKIIEITCPLLHGYDTPFFKKVEGDLENKRLDLETKLTPVIDMFDDTQVAENPTEIIEDLKKCLEKCNEEIAELEKKKSQVGAIMKKISVYISKLLVPNEMKKMSLLFKLLWGRLLSHFPETDIIKPEEVLQTLTKYFREIIVSYLSTHSDYQQTLTSYGISVEAVLERNSWKFGPTQKDEENSIEIQRKVETKQTQISKLSKVPKEPSVSIYIIGLGTSVNYPNSFLNTRGHNIEDSFMCLEEATDMINFSDYGNFKDEILKRLNSLRSELYLPEDLLRIFNTLSNNIRSQINQVIQPTSKKDSKLFSVDEWINRTKSIRKEPPHPEVSPIAPSEELKPALNHTDLNSKHSMPMEQEKVLSENTESNEKYGKVLFKLLYF